MSPRTAMITAIAAAFVAAATALAAPASAAEHGHHQFGSAQKIVDAGGAVVQEWVVADLQKSTTVLPGYTPRGQLWEASATVRAANGTVTPVIPNLSAVASGGQRYPVLWQIPNPQGLPATTLAQGQTASGKVFFDVTGAEPMAVIYDNGSGTHLMWCCDGNMLMPMDDCPMCAAMGQQCPHCRGRM
ncbi:MPT63 family protein [Mycobacterium sp. 852014-52144_SCH5372336]|uniref:MPT63 family protein n=1 Tax=Mycobacterium sp. 852014-52144_SCH5372336 TaxID=1834115 RepID=UPI0009ED0EFB|nr:MPT63 family protein [Mycobacterium sp. 852014-52144_SCH5372336]